MLLWNQAITLEVNLVRIVSQPAAMELSKKSEYALLAMLELAASYQNGEPLQIRQIAVQQSIPDRYLEQLLAELRRSGLIRSERGARGGYLLAREPQRISVLDVVNCMQGTDLRRDDPRDRAKTAELSSIVEIWQESREAANAVLQKHTLQDLLDQRNMRQHLNLMYYI